jgi:hypothetical protein
VSDPFADTARRGNPRSSGYERAPSDWYVEPRHAIDALLDAETFTGTVWDPACGSGNIPAACRARGINAIGTDIVDRIGDGGPVDFLTTQSFAAEHIITNPPFNLGEQFVLHGLDLVTGKVCILQRTAWLEGERRYQSVFRHGRLANVWQFRSRISMPPGDSSTPAKGGAVAFAWFVFSRGHSGPWSGGWLPI